MEPGVLVLGRLFGVAEHLARTRKVKAAIVGQVLQRRQQIMRPVDIGVQRRELVVERVADEALRRQVVALIRPHVVDHLVDAGVTFK